MNKNKENQQTYWKCKKWSNTNEVVWDVIWTAMNPEKMFWTAEIELYRCVMSNGPYGFKKNVQGVNMFWISDHHNGTMLLTTIFWMFWVLEWLWKIKIGARKSIFVKIFIKNNFSWTRPFSFLHPILSSFDFVQKFNFGSFFIFVASVFVILWSFFVKNPPPN